MLWNLNTGICTKILKGHSDCVNSIAFNPQNPDQIASGAADKTLKIWNLSTGECTNTLEGHTNCACSVAFNPHADNQIASGAGDKT